MTNSFDTGVSVDMETVVEEKTNGAPVPAASEGAPNQPGMIYGKLVSIMQKLGPVGKDQKNTHQNYNFRGIDDVMNAVNPLLREHGVFVRPEVLSSEREERSSGSKVMTTTILRVRFSFIAEDGSTESCVVQGEGGDYGDKSSNKAMSAAFKYAFLQIFCIPTEGVLDEGDADSPQASATKSETRAQKEQARAIGKDLDVVNQLGAAARAVLKEPDYETASQQLHDIATDWEHGFKMKAVSETVFERGMNGIANVRARLEEKHGVNEGARNAG